jgi:DNA-binding response OmpR family regulator
MMSTVEFSILVIEDNIMMQETLSELLIQEGHSVSLIDCGEALSELGHDDFDVVILDVHLPGEDGFSIAKRLRSNFPLLGIIMLTACNQPEDSIIGYVHGADNYFSKPFQPQVLLAAIQNLGHRVVEAKKTLQPNPYLKLDYLKKTLWFAERSVTLTPVESLILRNFTLAKDQTLEEWQLQELITVDSAEENSRHYLQVILSRLRKKLVGLTQSGKSIKNIRGLGYCLLINVRVI